MAHLEHSENELVAAAETPALRARLLLTFLAMRLSVYNQWASPFLTTEYAYNVGI